MKILVVCQYYYPEPFRVHEVCEALALRGHEVTVLTGTPNYPMGEVPTEYQNGKRRDEMIRGVHVVRVGEIPRTPGKVGLAKNYVSFTWNACWKALFMKKDFDVIFVYQLSPILMAIPAFVVKWFSKTKRIKLYCLDLWPESLVSLGIDKNSVFFRFIKWVSKKIYNSVDCLGYTSRQFENYFRCNLGLRQENYRYIPQFAESLFEALEPAEHEGVNLLFAGNVGEMQSVETIVRAAALVRRDDIRWHIVGDGSALERCRQVAREWGLETKVIFHGRHPVEKMPHFYSIADAMLVTMKNSEAISYTLPGKVQSYMAAGKPIICVANGETARVIREASCGVCCAAEDAEGLAMLVERFDMAEAKKYGENARKYYLEQFSKETHIERIERVLLQDKVKEKI